MNTTTEQSQALRADTLPDLLTVSETATYLRRGQSSVRRDIDEGRLPVVIVGRRGIRIPSTFIREMLAPSGGATRGRNRTKAAQEMAACRALTGGAE